MVQKKSDYFKTIPTESPARGVNNIRLEMTDENQGQYMQRNTREKTNLILSTK